MTYDKYIKYKIKYFKLKKLEQQLILEGKLLPYNNIDDNTQTGGELLRIKKKSKKNSKKKSINNSKKKSINNSKKTMKGIDNKFCINCNNNTNNNSACKFCNLNQNAGYSDILNINVLTDTPINNNIYNNLRNTQIAGNTNNLESEISSYVSSLTDTEFDNTMITNNNEIEYKQDINSESDSITLSILKSSE